MKLSGVTKMVKRQLVCNVFHNIKSDDFYIGTASAIYCATGFPLPLNRSQMGALLGISEDTMIEKVVYNDFDCAYKSDLEGFNLDDTVKGEVEVKKMAVGIYYMGEILIPVTTEDKHMVGLICWSQLAPVEDEGKEFLAYQEAMLAVVELIEKEPMVEKEYDVMFSGTEHIDSPGPAPVVGYRIAAKSWEEAVQKGKFYAEMQHPAFIPFAFAGPVIEVPKEELENLETEKK